MKDDLILEIRIEINTRLNKILDLQEDKKNKGKTSYLNGGLDELISLREWVVNL